MKSKYKKLLAIYDKIPSVECQGLCHESCTIAPATKLEVRRAKEAFIGAHPFKPQDITKIKTLDDVQPCKALKAGLCSIYRFRPTICRLYGAAEGLECQFGCVPKRYLTRTEARKILGEVEAL